MPGLCVWSQLRFVAMLVHSKIEADSTNIAMLCSFVAMSVIEYNTREVFNSGQWLWGEGGWGEGGWG